MPCIAEVSRQAWHRVRPWRPAPRPIDDSTVCDAGRTLEKRWPSRGHRLDVGSRPGPLLDSAHSEHFGATGVGSGDGRYVQLHGRGLRGGRIRPFRSLLHSAGIRTAPVSEDYIGGIADRVLRSRQLPALHWRMGCRLRGFLGDGRPGATPGRGPAVRGRLLLLRRYPDGAGPSPGGAGGRRGGHSPRRGQRRPHHHRLRQAVGGGGAQSHGAPREAETDIRAAIDALQGAWRS